MKTVSEMDSSDIGAFYCRADSGLRIGVITNVNTIVREFAQYKTIHFRTPGPMDSINLGLTEQSSHIDVYRIGEGPELWLGDIHEPSNITLPSGRVHLYDKYSSKFLTEEDMKLTWAGYLIFDLIEISEKELENHFNSLQFA
jgi:hypothetical protein